MRATRNKRRPRRRRPGRNRGPGNGLIEIGNRGLNVRRRAPVPGVAALEIQLVGLGILRPLFGDLLLFVLSSSGAQLRGDVAGDLLLQGNIRLLPL